VAEESVAGNAGGEDAGKVDGAGVAVFSVPPDILRCSLMIATGCADTKRLMQLRRFSSA
jgi:hypothetical protein